MLFDDNIVTAHTSLSERRKYTILRTNDFHIWQVALTPNRQILELCKSVLSTEEQKRVKWLKFEYDKTKYVISKGILRLLLADYLNINTSEISISRQRKGKPFVNNDNTLFFNMSDSGELCVFAFTRVGEIGIDIEKKRILPDLDDLIQKNLTKQEINIINKEPSEKNLNFLRFWTIKEAYLKAIGEGMRLTPNNLEFSIEKGNIKLVNQQGILDQEDWFFREFFPETSYFGVIVFKNEHTIGSHFILK